MAGMIANLYEEERVKVLRSPQYNYVFDKQTGFFARWGKTKDDDPPYSPFGPEILDLEISAGGGCLGNCPFCYKSNGGNKKEVHHLRFDDFVKILDKIPKMLTQIAFGIMNIHEGRGANPDFKRMLEESRKRGIIPNYTCHGLDVNQEIAEMTKELCGAVAVSIVNPEKSYDAVKMFTDAGMNQTNIHFMLSEETFNKALETVDAISTDPRLEKLNAIVFLQYKPKGRNPDSFSCIQSTETYKKLTDYCESRKVNYGFDSCSCPSWYRSMGDKKDWETLSQFGEPCESSCFSSYINCKGVFFPCSFAEGEADWKDGLSVLECDNFLQDIWFHPRVVKFRQDLFDSSQLCTDCKFKSMCRSCMIYDITPCRNEHVKK